MIFKSIFGLEIVDFNFGQAAKVAELRLLNCCLALTILQNATAVTADKDWQKLSLCQIEVIR